LHTGDHQRAFGILPERNKEKRGNTMLRKFAAVLIAATMFTAPALAQGTTPATPAPATQSTKAPAGHATVKVAKVKKHKVKKTKAVKQVRHVKRIKHVRPAKPAVAQPMTAPAAQASKPAAQTRSN
jgi:hypothetical protein